MDGPPGEPAGPNNAPSLGSPTRSLTPEVGPLPANWEKAVTENGETYFIDHSTGNVTFGLLFFFWHVVLTCALRVQ